MVISRKIPDEKGNDFFKHIFFLLRPYWLLFLLLVVLFLGAAYAYLKQATFVYESTAKLLIKDEKKGVAEAKTVTSLDGFSSKKIIDNEIEVLKSPNLTDAVTVALHLYAPVSEKKWFKEVAAYTSSPIIIEAADPAAIKKQERIYFSYNDTTSMVVINRRHYPLDQMVSTPYGRLKFSKNPARNQSATAPLFFHLLPVRSVSRSVNNKLSVAGTNKLSSIIQLKYVDEVPQRGEDVLNALLQAYNDISNKDRNSLTLHTLDFIDERLELLRTDLDSIERKIQQYKAGSGAVDLGTQGRLFLENVSNTDRQLGDINMQLAVLNQVNQYVTNNNRSNSLLPSTLGVGDNTLSLLVNKLYGAELEYENVKKTAGENNPIALALKEQIEQIKPGILENIQSQQQSLETSRANLAITGSGFNAALRVMPEKERRLIEINREQGTKRQIYNFLLQKKEETALSHASTVANNKLVAKARAADAPVSPKPKIIYLSALVAALASGVAFVLFREKLRGRIMFIQDIEALTATPIVGEIMKENSPSPIVIGEGKRTPIAEQFRKIRSAFTYLNLNSGNKKILITSSIAGEGKSFVAVNLALSLAIAGKKVALLDFDLSNPTLLNKLGAATQAGITEYVSGNCGLEDIIYPTDQHSNLFLLPTGELPLNPTEFMLKEGVASLLQQLESQFDYIVIDTSPIGPVTDAYILSPLCDATLYVIRHNYTPTVFVKRMDANNELHQLKNMALLFNGVAPRGFGSKNYQYGYGYQGAYANGYGKGSKKLKLLPLHKNGL